ncbi:MAG: hypothetical protein AAGA18_00530 [Verrucomicrobiota bacterium]
MIKAWLDVDHDFPDILSPIVVKELRQALRARWFIVGFLLLQLFMAGSIILASLEYASDPEEFQIKDTDGFFWFLLGMHLMLVMPLKAINSLSSERKANTLELMQLSNLGTWRIVLGKWSSIVGQILLVIISVIPYGVIRYFLGDVNLLEDLWSVFMLFLGSLLLSAAGIALSNFPTWVKGLGVFSILIFSTSSSSLFTLLRGSIVMTTGEWISILSLCLWDWSLLVIFGLLVGCETISASAENYTKWKRIVVLGALLPTIMIVSTGMAKEALVTQMTLCLALWGYVVIEGMTKSEKIVHAQVRDFKKMGLFGKLLGKVLYPVWPSCVLYVVISLIPFIGIIFLYDDSSKGLRDNMLATSALLFFAVALLLPKALTTIARWKPQRPLLWHIGFHISGILLFSFVAAITAITKDNQALYPLVFMPSSAALALLQNNSSDLVDIFFPASIAYGFVVIWVLVWGARRYLRRLDKEENIVFRKS